VRFRRPRPLKGNSNRRRSDVALHADAGPSMILVSFGASVYSCAVYRLTRRPCAGELCVMRQQVMPSSEGFPLNTFEKLRDYSKTAELSPEQIRMLGLSTHPQDRLLALFCVRWRKAAGDERSLVRACDVDRRQPSAGKGDRIKVPPSPRPWPASGGAAACTDNRNSPSPQDVSRETRVVRIRWAPGASRGAQRAHRARLRRI
jgi:hypothetical protein